MRSTVHAPAPITAFCLVYPLLFFSAIRPFSVIPDLIGDPIATMDEMADRGQL